MPIEDSYYTVHYSKEGELMHVVGKYKKDDIPTEAITPKISEINVFQLAKDAFLTSENIAEKEDLALVNDELIKLKEEKKIIPYLVYYRPDKKSSLKVCYRVDISSHILEKLKTVYIDATGGEIVKVVDYRSNNVATVATVYNGSRTNVQVEWRGWPYSYYYLRDESKASPIETRNSATHDLCVPWGFSNLDRVYKGDLNWPIDFKNNAASAHWAVQESYNVFKNVYGRTYGTHSSSGGEIRMENYYWTASPFYEPSGSNDYIHVGQTTGDSGGFEGGLDVIGHEFTHGVIYRARGVYVDDYSLDETGALIESFADIFGEIIEFYTLGQTDYIHNTNRIESNKRSLVNPKNYFIYEFTNSFDNNCKYFHADSTGYEVPTIWQDNDCWIFQVGELAAHVKCAVQNYWFYLLANGGSQNGVTITGIGIGNAANISYRNMVYYLSQESTFDDMRQASIANAIDLFGECTNEYYQVKNAWAAIGVGAPATACLSVNISGPGYIDYGELETWYSNVNGGYGNYYYAWYVDGNYSCNLSYTMNCFYPEELTCYPIELFVTDDMENEAYDEMLVCVFPEYGMKSSEDNPIRLQVYPNPASERTTLQIIEDEKNPVISKDEIVLIYLVDKSGRVLYKTATKNRSVEINTSELQKGVYTVISSVKNFRSSVNLIIN